MGSRALVVAAVVAVALAGVGCDFSEDMKDCSAKLEALATCLAFVQGQAPAPTPDCCAGLKTALQDSPRCLCVLVKDRDDPGLGLKINVTRALGLPAACSAPANISDCPRLLNLPPNSKDAQVFEQFAKQLAAQNSSSTQSFPQRSAAASLAAAATSPSLGGRGGGGEPSAPNTGAQKTAAAAATRMPWLGVGGVGGAVSLFFFAAVPLAVPFLILLG